MNQPTIQKLLQLNHQFYQQIASDFSQTRQNIRPGWLKLKPALKSHFDRQTLISVLDVACGNGIFAEFLIQEFPDQQFEYLGIDTNEKLLKEAKQRVSDLHFEFNQVDIGNLLGTSDSTNHPLPLSSKDSGQALTEGGSDIVVAFGITHHIPSTELRQQFFAYLSSIVKPGGLLIFTFWNVDQDPRFTKAVSSISTADFTIKESELDQGDYFLGWGNQTEVYRYVHIYSDQEKHQLHQLLQNRRMQMVSQLVADGKGDKLNQYWIAFKS